MPASHPPTFRRRQSRARSLKRRSRVTLRTATSSQPPKLKFSNDNTKLGRLVWTFSLPSGHTCPGACICLAKADLTTGKLITGPNATLRCFSATQEVAFKNTRIARRFNFDILRRLKTTDEIRRMLVYSMPKKALKLRIHVAGDFYSQAYFDAWMQVAEKFPKVAFYAYTKSIPFWRNWLNRFKKLPDNVTLTASLGGKFDDLILKSMVTAEIVDHPSIAKKKKLKIDKHDTLAQTHKAGSFALLLHGVQAAGSDKAAALKRMREEGIEYSYSRNKA